MYLQRLGLIADEVMSDGRDSFHIIRCHDAMGTPLMLKCVANGSASAGRRLANEALLVKHLHARAPLRLLRHRDDGPGYLVTEFDTGRLLRPGALDGWVVDDIADALVEFQSLTLEPERLGIVDRNGRAARYLKVFAKHIAHLWPTWINGAEAAECFAILLRCMPAILSKRAICHGDLLPTNLLYHAADRTVTFTDLEAFASADHPLFDILSLFTIEDTEITEWTWQPRFLAHYLARAGAALQLDPRSREFADAYRGILVFFLVYRLSESRIGLLQSSYFDGRSKTDYLKRKLQGILRRGGDSSQEDELAAGLRLRRRNLQRVLSPGYREHAQIMDVGCPTAN